MWDIQIEEVCDWLVLTVDNLPQGNISRYAEGITSIFDCKHSWWYTSQRYLKLYIQLN